MRLNFVLATTILCLQGRPGSAQPLKEDPLPPQATARLGTSLFRAGHDLHCLALSPDGRMLAAGAFDAVCLFEANTGRLVRRWTYHYPREIVFSLDNKNLLVAGSGEYGSRIIDVASGKDRLLMPPKMFARVAAFSPDRKRLAFAGPEARRLHIWDIEQDKHVKDHDTTGEVWHLHWSPDGQSIGMTLEKRPASVLSLQDFVVIDATTGKKKHSLSLTKPGWGDFAFSPTEKRIALCPSWGEIRLLGDSEERKVEALKEYTSHLGAVAFSPDGKRLASSDTGGGLTLWDVATGKRLRAMRASFTGRSCLVFSSDGKRIFSAGDQGVIRIWDSNTGEALNETDAPRAGLHRFTRTPDGKSLLASYRDYTSRVWDLSKRTSTVLTRKEPPLDRVCGITKDGKRLLWSTGFEIHLSDWESGKRLVEYSLERRGIGRPLHGAAFGAGEKTVIAGGSESSVFVFEVEKDRILREYKGVTAPISALSVSADGTMAFFGEGNGNVCLLDLTRGEVRWRVKMEYYSSSANFSCFSPDGRWVLARSSNVPLIVYDTATGQCHARFEERRLGVRAAFSPDGRMIAVDDSTTSADSSVRVWEVATGKLRLDLKGHRGAVTDVAFSLDGTALYSGGADSTILIWDLTGRLQFASLKGTLTKSEQESCWRALADADAAVAFEAMQKLVQSGQAVEALRSRLKPVHRERVLEVIAALGDDLREHRDEAKLTLLELGEPVRPILEDALARDFPSREAAREIPDILKQLGMKRPVYSSREYRQSIRAIEVLERVNSLDSRKLLQALAGGMDVPTTREAKRVLGL